MSSGSPISPEPLPGATAASHVGPPHLVSVDPSARSASPKLGDIVRQALDETTANAAALALESDGAFICSAVAGETALKTGAILDRNSGLSGLCVRTGKVLICRDADADARVNKEACRELGVRSIVTVPILWGGIVVGLLEVFSREPHAFDDRAIASLGKLADAIVANVFNSEGAQEQPEAEATPAVAEMSEQRRVPGKVLLIAALALVAILTFAALAFLKNKRVQSSAQGTAPADAQLRSPSAPPSQADTAEAKVADRASAHAGNLTQAELAQLEKQAARWGNGDAQYKLATAFAEGKGSQQDLVQAYAWYVIASISGNRDSEAAIKALTPRLSQANIAQVRFRLGEMFKSGRGVPEDYVKAYFWFAVSNAAGDPRARSEMDDLAGVMTPDEIARATNRADTWLAEHSSAAR